MASIVITPAETWAQEAAGRIAAALGEAVAQRGQASVALAGGGTPAAVHRALVEQADLAWQSIHIYFGDERCVAPDDADSNYAAALRTLLLPAGVDLARVHRMRAEEADRDAAAAAYGRELPPRLDVLVLGIGEDGHTASLFPGHAALAEVDRRVVAVVGPKPPVWRLTITPPVIAAARSVVVLARGEGKAQAVARALTGDLDPLATPAQLARRGTWILDTAAAAALPAAPPQPSPS